jgi:hypothetical protein
LFEERHVTKYSGSLEDLFSPSKELSADEDGPRIDTGTGVVTGTLVSFAADGAPQVSVEGRGLCAVEARSCIGFRPTDVGSRVVLIFAAPEVDTPIVLGLIRKQDQLLERPSSPFSGEATRDVEIDGRTVNLNAQEALTLTCGKASITLGRDGKIVIRGMHVVSHAAGSNCIRGGSVQLN